MLYVFMLFTIIFIFCRNKNSLNEAPSNRVGIPPPPTGILVFQGRITLLTNFKSLKEPIKKLAKKATSAFSLDKHYLSLSQN